jgi:hypothetical protein
MSNGLYLMLEAASPRTNVETADSSRQSVKQPRVAGIARAMKAGLHALRQVVRLTMA